MPNSARNLPGAGLGRIS